MEVVTPLPRRKVASQEVVTPLRGRKVASREVVTTPAEARRPSTEVVTPAEGASLYGLFFCSYSHAVLVVTEAERMPPGLLAVEPRRRINRFQRA